MDISSFSTLSLPASTTLPNVEAPKEGSEINAIKKSAKDFETAFITQMLTFSGLGDALTIGGGEAASAFSSFYLESVAEDIVEAGGFGLADKFYEKLMIKSGLSDKENDNVDFGTL